ncbi:SIMPL domain-containing protein, partial [Dehalococcoidia bacterium]|nr:SIMPL domain-containing protein [Dehalococcoidia bacterium]
MKKGWLVVISLVAAIALLGVAGCAAIEGGSPSPVAADTGNPQEREIWVSGQGRVSVTPDIAALRLGIEAQEDTVREAMTQAAESMEAVIAALKAHGVAEKDIRTFRFSITEAWEWDRITGDREFAGYLVSNMVSAQIRALDDVGSIIDAVVQAGGDLIRIHGIGFTVEDPTPYHYEAREKAFADAKAKAEQLAGLADLTLGKPTFISDGMAHFPPPMPMARMEMMVLETAGFPGPTPIMPGEQEVIVH